MAILMPPLVLEWSAAAIKAVMVVPILAPKMNGAALRNVVTFLATSGTTKDVVMVLDRMAAVNTVPQANDLK